MTGSISSGDTTNDHDRRSSIVVVRLDDGIMSVDSIPSVVRPPILDHRRAQAPSDDHTVSDGRTASEDHARSNDHNSSDDPLDRAIAPPPNETPQERKERIQREREARRVSDEIDLRLRIERNERKRKRVVKVLLLGKSTTLKNFQLNYTPSAFQRELLSWRSVIHLNLLRSIHTIISTISSHTGSFRGSKSSSKSSLNIVHPHKSSYGSPPPTPTSESFQLLLMRLSPLRHAEELLRRKFMNMSLYHGEEEYNDEGDRPVVGWETRRSQEMAVRSGVAWKMDCRTPIRTETITTSSSSHASTSNPIATNISSHTNKTNSKASCSKAHKREKIVSHSNDMDHMNIIEACKDDMISLWANPSVQSIIKARRLRVEESSGFFLGDIDRIARKSYIPTEEDVLRARLRTVGVQEYHLQLEAGPYKGSQWCLIDVGGARSQRASWAPFFDDANAIIFLAPISTFDQCLAEDKRINRVEDSLLLWKSICSNRLLQSVALILFLNKCDILKTKLDSGVKVNKYVPSFRDLSNDWSTVTRYFRAKFKAIHREYSPQPRTFYGHFTSVTDPSSTSGIMASVSEIILTEHLKSVHIL